MTMLRTITLRPHPALHQPSDHAITNDWLQGLIINLSAGQFHSGTSRSEGQRPNTYIVPSDWPKILGLNSFSMPVPEALQHTDTWQHWTAVHPGWLIFGINDSPVAALALPSDTLHPPPIPLAGLSVRLDPQADPIVLHLTPDITHLDLSNHQRLTSLEPVGQLQHLRELDLSQQRQVIDLSPLAALIQLQHLRLKYWPFLKDIRPLAALTHLRSLDLTLAHSLSNISPLASLAQLEWLSLSCLPVLSDVSPLAPLHKLKCLHLSNCPELRDITPLSSLTALEILSLDHCSLVPNLLPLAPLQQLQKLSLTDCWRIAPDLREAVENEDFARFRALLSCTSAPIKILP